MQKTVQCVCVRFEMWREDNPGSGERITYEEGESSRVGNGGVWKLGGGAQMR